MFGVLAIVSKVSGKNLYKNTTSEKNDFSFFLLFGNYTRDHRADDKYGCRGYYYYIRCGGYISRSGTYRSKKSKRHKKTPFPVDFYYYIRFPQKFQ